LYALLFALPSVLLLVGLAGATWLLRLLAA
jgi:hypothetical protein